MSNGFCGRGVHGGASCANLDLVADPDKNFLVIMKGGQVFKNALV